MRSVSLAIVLLSSIWTWRTPTPDDLVRQGNAAYARGEYAAALRLYQQAEDRTDDPGLVAFNEAAALYQLGRYREAEDCYGRCREDATGARLARLLYGLGNSLVQQAQPGDAVRLDRAIGCYDECLKQSDAAEDLLADARHNREVALQLRAQEPPAGPRPNSGDPSEPPSDGRPNSPGEDERNGSPLARGAKQQGAAKQRPGGTPTPVDEPPPPGKGNLPPVPDQDELASMSVAEAQAHLEEALARIRHEQREHRQRTSSSPSRQVPDW